MNYKSWSSLIMIPVILIATLGTTGCPNNVTPKQVAGLAKAACDAVNTVIVIENTVDPVVSQKLSAACSVLAADVSNWQAGTGTYEQVLQAVTVIEDVLNTVKIGDAKTQQLVALAFSLFQAIVVLFPPQPKPSIMASTKRGATTTMSSADAEKVVKNFKKNWNNVVKSDPKLNVAEIK